MDSPDDTQDKIRRNTVTLSAAIIAIAFLDLNPLTNPPWFGESIKNISASKFWLVTLILQIYFALRFHTDKSNKKNENICKERFYKMRAKLITNGIEKNLRNFLRNDDTNNDAQMFKLPFGGGNESGFLTRWTGKNAPLEINVAIDWHSPWKGDANITLIAKNGKTEGAYVPYKVATARRVAIQAYALTRSVTAIQADVLEYVFPYAITICALMVSWYKLFKA